MGNTCVAFLIAYLTKIFFQLESKSPYPKVGSFITSAPPTIIIDFLLKILAKKTMKALYTEANQATPISLKSMPLLSLMTAIIPLAQIHLTSLKLFNSLKSLSIKVVCIVENKRTFGLVTLNYFNS